MTNVFHLVSRIAAAVLGGYAFTQVVSILIAYLLPGTRSDGVMFALMLSFLIYMLAILWVFAVRSVWRAWAGLLGPTVLVLFLLLVLMP